MTETVTEAPPLTPLELFNEFQGWARGIYRRYARVLPSSVDRNDLWQAALIGLWDASKKYREEMGCHFRNYSRRRILGEMLHHVRTAGTFTLGPKRGSEVERSYCESTIEELAESLYAPEQTWLLDEEDAARYLLRDLPERNRLVLWRCVIEGWEVKRAGSEAGVSESRVYQIVRESIRELRKQLETVTNA